MRNKRLILSAILTLAIIQNCTTTEKVESKAEPVDKELHAELQVLKSMLGN